ncbi:MAG: pyruvate kinase [Trebonia sp.]
MCHEPPRKIVCTLGLATSAQERINALITAGLDVARLNLSHGSHADHLNAYQLVRAGSDAIGRSVGVLADLQGPKIRLGEFPGGAVLLTAGDEFTITTDDIPGDRHEASTTYLGLADDVRAGDRILIDDGNVQVDVTGVAGTRVRTRVVAGGRVSDHKGINLPGVAVSAPALTAKDQEDLRWALATGVDIVAMSFVRSPDDAMVARKIMNEAGRSVGAYPVETVATMARIVSAAEDNSLRAEHSLTRMPTTTGGAIARAAAEVGAIVGAKALVAFTMTGETARRLARYRSPVPLLAFTTEPATRSQLALTWGVETFIVPAVRHTDDMVHEVDSALVRLGRCTIGDKIVIVAGSPPGSPGKTNALRVHRIGDAIELPYP